MNILIVAVIILSFLLPITAVVSFLVGANVYQKASANKEIPVPTIKQKKKKPERDESMLRFEKILHNIDVYDGTSLGQED